MDFPASSQQDGRYGFQSYEGGANVMEKRASLVGVSERSFPDHNRRADTGPSLPRQDAQPALHYDMRQQEEQSWLVKVNTPADATYKCYLHVSNSDGTTSKQLVYLRKARLDEIAEIEDHSIDASSSYCSAQQFNECTLHAGQKRRAEDVFQRQHTENDDNRSCLRGEHRLTTPIMEYSDKVESSFWNDFYGVDYGESSREQNQSTCLLQKSMPQQNFRSANELSDPFPAPTYSTRESFKAPAVVSNSSNIAANQLLLYSHNSLYSDNSLQSDLSRRDAQELCAILNSGKLRHEAEGFSEWMLPRNNFFPSEIAPDLQQHFTLPQQVHRHEHVDSLSRFSANYPCSCPQCRYNQVAGRSDAPDWTKLGCANDTEVLDTSSLIKVRDWDVPLGYTREGTTGLRIWREIRGERRRLDVQEAEELISLHRKKVVDKFLGHMEKIAPTFLKECKNCIASATHVWTRQGPYGMSRQTFWCHASLEDIRKDVNTKRAKR